MWEEKSWQKQWKNKLKVFQLRNVLSKTTKIKTIKKKTESWCSPWIRKWLCTATPTKWKQDYIDIIIYWRQKNYFARIVAAFMC